MTPRHADDFFDERGDSRERDTDENEFGDDEFDAPREEDMNAGESDFDDDETDDPREEDMDAGEGDDDEPGAYCPECGAGVFELANRCPSCGRDITPASRPPWRFSRSIFLPLSLTLLLTAALLVPLAGFVCR